MILTYLTHFYSPSFFKNYSLTPCPNFGDHLWRNIKESRNGTDESESRSREKQEKSIKRSQNGPNDKVTTPKKAKKGGSAEENETGSEESKSSSEENKKSEYLPAKLRGFLQYLVVSKGMSFEKIHEDTTVYLSNGPRNITDIANGVTQNPTKGKDLWNALLNKYPERYKAWQALQVEKQNLKR